MSDTSTGVSLQDTAAILAKLTDGRLTEGDAEVVLRKAFINLVAPVNKARQQLNRFGVLYAENQNV